MLLVSCIPLATLLWNFYSNWLLF